MAISGVVIMVLYSMVSYGLSMVQTRRESSAATQAIIDQFERVRLLTWTQLTNDIMYPRSYEYTNGINGTKYDVTISVDSVPDTLFPDAPSYQGHMSLVTVHVAWGENKRTMENSALVAQYGLQGFVKHDIE